MWTKGTSLPSITIAVAAIAATLGGCKLIPPTEVELPPVVHPVDAGHKELKHGHELFHNYCASCHGVTAQGNGPLAGELRRAPSDLTLIAKRRNGVFPEHEILQIIDGRRHVRGHGPGNMPVWGRRFSTQYAGGYGDEDDTIIRMRLFEMVNYLKSIQVED